MKLYADQEQYKLYHGSMLDMLEVIEPNTIDSIVTDPPYELGFMGKSWDNTGIAFKQETWEKCFEVLKPGGYLLAFGGTRTYHRIACAIEDAGFEIRDCIMWLYGSGFPKSMNIGKGIEAKEKYGKASTDVKRRIEQECNTPEYTLKQTNNGAMGEIIETTRKEYIPNTKLAKQWNGWGTALKPSFEPIIVARKPFKGSLVDNVMEYGVGGINIDECRIATDEDTGRVCGTNRDVYGGFDKKTITVKNKLGRFPSNVIHDGSEEVISGFPDTNPTKPHDGDGLPLDTRNMGWGFKRMPSTIEDNGGSASRYFYCAKASKKDRDEGLDMFDSMQISDGSIRSNSETGRKYGANPVEKKNIHPTVKPVELMQYLVRLVTPKNGTTLDCFCGSGSTGKATMFENREREANYKFIGIELTKEYLPICEARIDYALNKYEYDFKKELEEAKSTGQQNIFDLLEAD